jgi:hypothetical protein
MKNILLYLKFFLLLLLIISLAIYSAEMYYDLEDARWQLHLIRERQINYENYGLDSLHQKLDIVIDNIQGRYELGPPPLNH